MPYKTLARRIISTLKAVKMGWKEGGAVVVNVAQIHHGNTLAGKHILITGATSGIGLEIARKCIAEGAMVLITGRNQQRLDKATSDIGHSRVKSILWDVADTKDNPRLFAAALELLDGRIDVLVNNAGVISTLPFAEVSEADWDSVYSTNSKGIFFMSQLVSNHWIRLKSPGKIINISSSGGFLGAPGPYRMSKWDIVGLTKGLGTTLYPHGIIVNGIAPGMTATKMLNMEQNQNAYVERYRPSQRAAVPEEIAEIAAFLMSDATNNIIGHTIICDGGFSNKI